MSPGGSAFSISSGSGIADSVPVPARYACYYVMGEQHAPPPELKKVTVDLKTPALLVMGFVVDSCNVQRHPPCGATIPQVRKLLVEARMAFSSCTAFQQTIRPETLS